MSIWAQIGRALGGVLTGARTPANTAFGGLITGAATIFFAYIGFEAVSTAGAESKNPGRTCRSASSARSSSAPSSTS
jgi:APA family basic amino acid/polyamine antiporter